MKIAREILIYELKEALKDISFLDVPLEIETLIVDSKDKREVIQV